MLFYKVFKGWKSVKASASECSQKGNIIQNGNICSPDDSFNKLTEFDDENGFQKLLTQCNGFYGVVVKKNETLYAAVDQIRSIPLFYGNAGNDFYISDNIEWVCDKIGVVSIDPSAYTEFEVLGHVSGSRTLFDTVYQLQAGEYLIASYIDGKLNITTKRHYIFTHVEPNDYDEKDLYVKLDQVSTNVVKRLVEFANGRQIVIPLSGGYDSRLIAILLKECGCKNIVAFSYGTRSNKEVKYSKAVADNLGINWLFVKYKANLWQKFWKSGAWWEYEKWASAYSSLAHYQDLLAVNILKKKKLLDDDCIFVPGHAADFVAGSHISKVAFQRKSFSISLIIDEIYNKYYRLAPASIIDTYRETGKKKIQSIVYDILGQKEYYTDQEFANAFEYWGWQERQAKFIANSVRVYEFYEFSWWLPYWDKDFAKFWQNVPLHLRKNRIWYIKFVQNKYRKFEHTAILNTMKNAEDRNLFLKTVKQLILWVFPIMVTKKIAEKKSILDIKNGNLRLFGIYHKNDWEKYIKMGYSTNGVCGKLFLQRVLTLFKKG